MVPSLQDLVVIPSLKKSKRECNVIGIDKHKLEIQRNSREEDKRKPTQGKHKLENKRNSREEDKRKPAQGKHKLEIKRNSREEDKRKPTVQGLRKQCITKNLFSYLSTQTYVVGTQKNRLNETVLLSTQNTC